MTSASGSQRCQTPDVRNETSVTPEVGRGALEPLHSPRQPPLTLVQCLPVIRPSDSSSTALYPRDPDQMGAGRESLSGYSTQAGAEDPVTLSEERPHTHLVAPRLMLSSSVPSSSLERSSIYIIDRKRAVSESDRWL